MKIYHINSKEILDSIKEIKSNEQGRPIDIKLIENEMIQSVDSLNEEKYFGVKNIFLMDDLKDVIKLGNSFIKYYRYGKEDYELVKNPNFIFFDSSDNILSKENESSNILGLIKNGVSPNQICIIGNRNLKSEELNFIRQNGIRYITMNQIYSNIDDSCDILMESVQGEDNEIFLSINLNVIDPAFSPCVKNISSGGLSSRDILYFAQRLNRLKKLKTISFYGYDKYENELQNNMTLNLFSRIIAEFL